MAQYLLSVYIDESETVTEEEMEQAYQQVDEFNEEVRKAGAWVFAGGLHPTSAATVVRLTEGNVVTTDGPFVHDSEVLGGFWVIEAPDQDTAVGWARKATAACMGPVEVRPFQDQSD